MGLDNHRQATGQDSGECPKTVTHALQISEHSEISRHAENHVKHFIVFKMHYGFQHILKFSFQYALQISEHSEIFKMLFQDVFNTFQT